MEKLYVRSVGLEIAELQSFEQKTGRRSRKAFVSGARNYATICVSIAVRLTLPDTAVTVIV